MDNQLLINLVTALLGLLAYVAGQSVLKHFKPAWDLRSLFKDIERDFLLYADRDEKMSTKEKRYLAFRERASALYQILFVRVEWYGFFKLLLKFPPREDVIRAANLLLTLSKSQLAGPDEAPVLHPWSTMNEIKTLLRLKINLGQPGCDSHSSEMRVSRQSEPARSV